jgi:hypothetical protein
MAERYLLYIDILGFSDLVTTAPTKVQDLFEVIASLNVHDHSAFRAIAFSDTILVYNVDGGHTSEDRRYLVMFLCEFAQDLQYRLTARGIFFRALLVRGDFTHYELNALPCFFGPALIDAYQSEKQINAIGLFMQGSIVSDSDIFDTVRFKTNYDFVFITQNLKRVEDMGRFPLDRFVIEETELIYHLVPEVLYLKQLNHWMTAHPDAKVRLKYANTWRLFLARYPNTLKHLKATEFELDAISPGANWDVVASKFPEDYSWAIKKRVAY